MMNYYNTLGVAKTATADEIKKAYRKLASQHHPDKGGDTKKFQEVEEAYRTLGDENKRAAYDNPHMHRPYAQHQESPFDLHSIFDMFGARFNHAPRSHARINLWITLQDVADPGPRIISVGTSTGAQTIEIEIPTGINDNDNVQYEGLAPGGQDLVVTFKIKPDEKWQRQGSNLITTLTATVWQLTAGADVHIQDIKNNQLVLTIPPMTQPGSMLRIKNRGLPDRAGQHGDMLVKMAARIPHSISPELMAAIRREINH
jgi:curved DNA-binding protein